MPKVIINWWESWNSLIQLNKHLLIIYYISSTVIGARNIKMSKTIFLEEEVGVGRGEEVSG